MQIFILDYNIQKNSMYYVNRHVCKTQTEIAQMLSTVYHKRFKRELPEFLYKPTHEKHPCVFWIQESIQNFEYTIKLGLALHDEYNFRYPNRKYQREKTIFLWAKDNLPSIEYKRLTPFAQAMPEKYKSNDAVKSYRAYYLAEKSHLFKWTNRQKPKWIKDIK